MPWPVRSQLLGFHSGNPTGSNVFQSFGSVPAGKKWLVKDYRIFNNSGTSSTFYVIARSSGLDYVIDTAIVAGGGLFRNLEDSNVCLDEGWELGWQRNAVAGTHILVSGAQLG